ncbi:WD40 repeat domain-containing protein [Streptomyces collinus]|uniref:WD40 repeat protein n=1 Tax=Streptomyces collinus TaxID=42684 RepID=A0AA89U0E3_STRCU|nr:WD40 repeat domain-containing protein [Streptomyces collinus]MBB5814618.1 WD40 repeat protein [Streptomyces collinus]WMX67617.1 WD40 repeat domain-containing protein [Streptomyces collinus]
MESETRQPAAPDVTVLSIGVGSFDDGSDMEELGFVPARMSELQEAFDRLGAKVGTSLDPTEIEVEALLRGQLVDSPPASGVVVVHLIGHGRIDRGHRLSFVARDHREVDVDRWIEKAQQEIERGGKRHRVVFLLDTCSAGVATGRQPLTEIDADRGVWALGAAVSNSPTEQGRFSSRIAAALHRLADLDLHIDEESISFSRFVRELIRVIRSEPADQRLSLGFSVELGDADWPFLPNPRLVSLTPEQLQARRRSLGHVPGEGDSGGRTDDTAYFADRASGRGLVPVDTGIGFFSGRTAELTRYMEWLSGTVPLLTVTGAAGAGKSGLLGVIVCAADPGLRRRFRELWESSGLDLPEVPDVVAVHARQRSAQQVIAAIAAVVGARLPQQADDQEAGGREWSTSPQTAEALRFLLDREQKNRLIVLDAVDESTEPQAVLRLVAELLAPRSVGEQTLRAPCRILLGGRREVVIALSALEEAADIDGVHIDLDSAELAAVEQDVQRYVQRLLATREPYATGESSPFTGLLARKGAAHIVRGARPDEPWGPFLLAGLYVHFLLTLKYPPRDEVGADMYAKAASPHLPALLESILKTRRDDYPHMRAVLAVLARSRGDGMPRTTLKRCLRALGVDSLDEHHFQDTLWEASPFLRYGSDPQSGETLYRLFHQGLVDYLHDHPTSEEPLDEAGSLALEGRLLSELVGPYTSDEPGHGDSWEGAEGEPYVLRHALGHAARARSVAHAESLLTDPYFLVRFDLRADHRALDLVRSEQAADFLRLLSASWATHARLRGAAERASVFAFDADRLGLPDARERFSRIAQDAAVQPEGAACRLLWSSGGHVNSNSRSVVTAGTTVYDIAFSPDGSLLAAATNRGVQVLETETWQSVAPLFGRTSHTGVNKVAFSPDGRLLAFARRSFTRSVQLWDVHNRVMAGTPWQHGTGTVTALTFSSDSRRLAVASEELGVSVWDITGDDPCEEARWDLRDTEDLTRLQAVAFSPVGYLLAVCSSRGTTLWDLTDGRRTLVDGERYARSVCFSPDGGLVAVAAAGGPVALYSVATRGKVGSVAVSAGHDLAFTPDGSLLVVGGWQEFHVVDTASMHVVNRLPVAARSASIAVHPDTSVLVSGDEDGHLRLWKSLTVEASPPQLPQFDKRVVGSPDGSFIAVQDADNRLLSLRNPVTGEEIADWSCAEPLSDLTSSPDGSLLAATSFQRLYVFPTDPAPLRDFGSVRLSGKASSLLPLVFSPDSRLIGVALGQRGSVQFVEVREARTLNLCARIPVAGQLSSFGFAGPQLVYVVVDGALGTYSCTPPEPEAPLP